jgi:hypothetical protein
MLYEPTGYLLADDVPAPVGDFFSLSKLSLAVPQEPRDNLVRIPVLQQQGAQRRVDPSSGTRSKQELPLAAERHRSIRRAAEQ